MERWVILTMGDSVRVVAEGSEPPRTIARVGDETANPSMSERRWLMATAHQIAALPELQTTLDDLLARLQRYHNQTYGAAPDGGYARCAGCQVCERIVPLVECLRARARGERASQLVAVGGG